MANTTIRKNYAEINLDGMNYDRHYKNPLTKAFQYEYALFKAVSNLFCSVTTNSMCLESLKLYFSELPHKGGDNTVNQGAEWLETESKNPRTTQEGVMEKVTAMVARDVIGNITFPMMNICAAMMYVIPNEDGTHSFVFTDGLYGFTVHMETPGKGTSGKVTVTNLFPEKGVIKGDEHSELKLTA